MVIVIIIIKIMHKEQLMNGLIESDVNLMKWKGKESILLKVVIPMKVILWIERNMIVCFYLYKW